MNDNIKIEPDPKSFLMYGVFAGPIFILAVLIQGVMQTDYNSLRYPLSSLSIGDSGWMQIANFIIAGTLLLIFSFGLRQVFNSSAVKSRGPLLIGLAGIGLIGAGLFVTDPIFGYPYPPHQRHISPVDFYQKIAVIDS